MSVTTLIEQQRSYKSNLAFYTDKQNKHVTDALQAVEGVEKADVDLKKKRAVVTLAAPVADETLIAVVKEAGYEASIKN